MDNKKKIFTLVIVLILVALLVAGGTFALWTWTSSVNKNVVFNTVGNIDKYVVYDSGNSYFVGNFQPTDTFCESTSTTLSFYKKEEIANVNLLATIKMDINAIGSNIAASDDVYWIVTKGDSNIDCASGLTSSSVLSYGTFNGVAIDETLTLLDSVSIPLGTKVGNTLVGDKYTVWIWIDSTGTDLSNLSGDTIDTNVWTEITMYEKASTYTEEILNGADPVLESGMIPVTIADNGDVTTADISQQWYSYSNKEWANAVLVNSDNRMNYYNTDGTIKGNQPVTETDILAYFVWIPKYSYKMNGTEQPILISFNSTPTGYNAHPAFNFNTGMLGFWVGKFETTGTGTSPTILPNIESLRGYNPGGGSEDSSEETYGTTTMPNYSFNKNNTTNLVQDTSLTTLSDFFKVSLKFAGGIQSGSTITFTGNNTYGLTENTDSHMMKNSEWGAVAYLSHSTYGINEEIRINNNSSYITGCGASSVNGSSTSVCQIEYGKATEYPQSTTGNISGVFDMSGGIEEYVMGNQWVDSSGFSTFPASKYYDRYPSSVFTGYGSTNMDLCTLATCGGHALNETYGWYSDYARFVDGYNGWFRRGGYYSSGESAGAFSFDNDDGRAVYYYGFRLVATKGE